ncbi:MAG: ABC transporter permease [Defluviitaleaceae bacterium]|nr:ABC transporter permease [Defluviitaleaceae bacterium]
MLKFFIHRLLAMIPVILGVIFIVFTIMSLTPGTPGSTILGIMASQDEIDALNRQLGYDRPFLERFVRYASGAVRGDFGNSYLTGEPVFNRIFSRLPITALLATLVVITAVMIGVPLGILSAVRRYSALDLISTVSAMFLAAVPEFWLGILLILLFALRLSWLPTFGVDSLRSFILPTLAMSLPAAAAILRLTRATMLETIRQDYIRTARAKGAPERNVIWKHALRNALIPVITMVGAFFGALFGGTILTETVFTMPGLGLLTLDAIRMNDTPQVMASVIFLSMIFCVIMLIVDIALAFIDPRAGIRQMGARE